MNSFMDAMKDATNFGYTENHAIKHLTTNSAVYDMFAFGGAFRKRSEEDCILLFKNALEEDAILAIKCLFYISDCRGGQGERRFFRVCFRWLCNNYPEIAKRNLIHIPTYRRWDDLIYTTIGTKLENEAFGIIKHQFALDCDSKTPSLLAKWMPSENASAKETKIAATAIRSYMHMSHKQYRKMLSYLRTQINVLEKLMSSNQWDKIEFDKIPSKAGLVYKNAFARRDIIAKKYEAFAKNENTTVNASTLYPYDVVGKVTGYHYGLINDTDRAMLEKYWTNLPDYLDGKECKMMCVVDTSGSMRGYSADAPINVAISLGMYCAERIGGPFANHYISFASRPQLIKVEGVDFVDKVQRIYKTNLCDNTNLTAVFDLLLDTARKSKTSDIPETIVVISDMQIDSMTTGRWNADRAVTEMEAMRMKWAAYGYKLPKLVYWNCDARDNTILDAGPNVSFVSGCSPIIFKQVVTGVTGYQLMLNTLNAERYEAVC